MCCIILTVTGCKTVMVVWDKNSTEMCIMHSISCENSCEMVCFCASIPNAGQAEEYNHPTTAVSLCSLTS